MISANVIEELCGSGWTRDDVQTRHIEGKTTHEELWRKNKSVELRHLGKTVKLFSGEDDCLQSLFSTFEDSTESYIVIREASRLRIYSEKGEEFFVHLPIPLRTMWKSAFGLILEGKTLDSDPSDMMTPKLLVLQHPLDDFTRIVSKQNKTLVEWKNNRHQLLMVSENPSLAVSYDSDLGLHTVWMVRKCEEEDLVNESGCAPDVIGSPMMRHSTSFKQDSNILMPLFNTSRTSMIATPKNPLSQPSSHQTTPQSHISSRSVSFDLRSGRPTPNTSISNPNSFDIKSGKPTPNNSVSQPNSPNTLAKICRSPSMIHHDAKSRIFMSPTIKSTEDFDISRNPEEPLPPDIGLCLEHVWTSSLGLKQHGGVSSKVFLCKDIIGQSFLCFLIHRDLVLVKLENDLNLTFGVTQRITDILDAAPFDQLGMVLILDGMNKLNLYSGSLKVCGVHFNYSPSVQLAHISQEIATLQIDSKDQSKMITSSRPPSRSGSAIDPKFFNDSSMVLLSPVSSRHGHDLVASSNEPSPMVAKPTPKLKSLHAVLKTSALLEYNNGVFVRLALPKLFSSSLVQRCFGALKLCIKDKEACHSLMMEWYCTRNSPGPSSISNTQEWNMFVKCLMKQFGYHVESINFSTDEFSTTTSKDNSVASPTTSKKMKHSEDGCDGDWQNLLTSKRHHESGKQLSFVLGIENISPDTPEKDPNGVYKPSLNTKSPLFSHIIHIFQALHLLYEDSKLNKFCWKSCPLLATFLSRLSADLDLPKFVEHYWKEFPTMCHMSVEKAKTDQVDPKILQILDKKSLDGIPPPCIFETLQNIIKKIPLKAPFPILPEVTSRTQDIILIYALYMSNGTMIEPEKFCQNTINAESLKVLQSDNKLGCHGRIVEYLVERGYNSWTVQSVPVGFVLPILISIYDCRLSPPLSVWTPQAFELIGRPELQSKVNEGDHLWTKAKKPKDLLDNNTDGAETIEDGLEDVESEITRLRWPNDQRISEVRKLLQSARPVIIGVQQRPEVSDHDFVEEQERNLQSLCIRTMALPVGRGAMAFQCAAPLPTEPVSVPRLCLSGKAPPRGTTVEMDHIEVVPNMDRWPSFHNGVAAGLRIPMGQDSIDSTWITFNKPKEATSHPNELVEHGGFLMALGLNGHLSKLGKLESFDYLIHGNEMISIGLLLGMSAAKRGSMDLLATKKISTQLEALLPPTATDLPLSHTTQVAGLVGLGLLYQGTGHRHMAEVCLTELGRPPGPEMENCTDRESYSLAAGLALGMITLGQGESLQNASLNDLNLPESLYYHMVGGPRPDALNKFKFRSPSYQVQEGDTINIDVTSPGATLALGLMFFRSNNARVATWLEVPDSRFLLEFVRPDFLMLRTLAKGLILWDAIIPDLEWIESHVPASMRPHCLVRPSENAATNGIDYETINQAYCNIIAGAALAMGMRFAGTANNQAFEALFKLTKKLMAISKRSVAELAGKATMEQTICIMVLALSIVMAGSGDLDVIRLVRFLRSRVGPNKHSTVTYGSHMALHMALGLLFLGGGRYTLNTRPESVAAMLAAFFPKFPTHSNDNRYHLQALRHLYVLAAEPRLIIPKDVKSGTMVFSHITVEFLEQMWYPSFSLKLKAPTMLPELHLLKRVSIDDERYHKLTFENLEALRHLLDEGQGILNVKQKAGCLPYHEDPKGFRSLTAQVLTKDTSFHWSLTASSELLSSFSSEPGVSCFSRAFVQDDLKNKILSDDNKYEDVMGSLLYECASHEKLDLLPFWITTFQHQWQLHRPGHFFIGPQLSLIMELSKHKQSLICSEIVSSISQSLKLRMDLHKKRTNKQSTLKDLMICEEEDLGVTNSLYGFENLNVLPLNDNVTSLNPLSVIKSKILSGYSTHTLTQLTK